MACAQVGFVAAVCWAMDVLFYTADQRQMDKYSEPRELPVVKLPAEADGKLEVEWVIDRDQTGRTSRRRSKAIWIPHIYASKEAARATT